MLDSRQEEAGRNCLAQSLAPGLTGWRARMGREESWGLGQHPSSWAILGCLLGQISPQDRGLLLLLSWEKREECQKEGAEEEGSTKSLGRELEVRAASLPLV